jgi:hypothetical protein
MRFEPVALTELIRQGILALIAFGLLKWNDQQTAIVLMFVSALLAYIARSAVTPNATIEASDTTVHEVKAQANANALLKNLVVAVALSGAFGLSGCGGISPPPPPGLTQEAVSAFKSHEVLKTIDALRDTAINAEKAQLVSEETTRKFVTLHLSAARMMEAAQVGRIAIIKAGLVAIQDNLPANEAKLLKPYIALALAVLETKQ